MKTLVFRPLRFVKKSSKIVVASYSQWYKVKTADYSRFNLVIDDEYKAFDGKEYVFNHNGEHLFWRDYNPSDINLFNVSMDWNLMKAISPNFAWGAHGFICSYHAQGLDCQGTPTFSHGTIENIVGGHSTLEKIDEYQLLTVDIVRKWFGWFLYNLNKASLSRK